MYVNPFVLGVITTVLVEFTALFVYAVFHKK